MRPLLELNNISYSYHTIDGETKALSDISFQLAPGEFAAVVGPSGCGKSTLLSLIAGLIEAENGTIFLDGEPSEKSFRKSAKIGYMLQHDHLFEWRSILKNVLLGAEINKSVSQETKQRAKELLRQYGLKRFINSRPSELSGGMRQRAALIRTLMPNPELLLLDEPFSPHRHGQQHRRALGVAVDQDRHASDGQEGHRDAQKAQEDAGAESAQGGNQPPHPQQGDQADRYAVAEQAEHQRRAGQKQLRHGGDSPQPRLIGVAVGSHQP